MLQVLVNDRDYAWVAHMSEKSEARYALSQILQLSRVLRHMVTDGAKEFTQGTWGKPIK